ncbi:M3 family metallopeptidase, partial [Streptomyces sp. SID10244]|nr:M3 family metallopeptidase [Streptomyces sp. SID10244]
DLTFWLERDRRSNSAVPLDDFENYCELDTVLERGVFHAAGKLYGLRFTERGDLAGYHPDVRIWEVFSDGGRSIGLFLGDYFARPSKRGGAWMNNIVDQSTVLSTQPVVVNVLNLTKPDDGKPCLLTMDQLTTLFHEFG